MTKFILGTANFNRNYGSLEKNKITMAIIKEIISLAQKKNINHFDTAKSYLGVEKILGEFLDKTRPILIDSKLSQENCSSVKAIITSIEDSLELLGVSKLSTIYIHNSDLLLKERGEVIIKALNKILKLELVTHLGVSVYNMQDLISCKLKFPSLTRFQINENICDRRNLNEQKLIELSAEGNIIDVRSIFLQGLLLFKPDNIPKKFKKASITFNFLNKYAVENGVSVLDLCIAYAKLIPWANGIVIGVNSSTQLDQIFQSNFTLPENWANHIPSLPNEFLDPREWRL
jgi:aryl-alcohol dehydrogenase-like predicted oxidoreductase